MHHQIDLMRKDQSIAPFIVAPESGKFGHIKKFHVEKRGRGGAAIELSVQTHNGIWLISKELVIRSVFENSQLKLKRLKSAKLYFDHKIDNLGFLQHLTVTGLGWGHGVGMQQTGAQGWAKLGKSCAEILAHYFANAQIERT
jgi:SpoIID/LytB domain protein